MPFTRIPLLVGKSADALAAVSGSPDSAPGTARPASGRARFHRGLGANLTASSGHRPEDAMGAVVNSPFDGRSFASGVSTAAAMGEVGR